ncbi:pseudouridylate synthase TRUB2, mitochondrial isoform X2 [Bacillus rossius redtenbacheri]|uniref:pseudouridylate synthase TRUB2, mitochondrial isoform X2 n=1 Tax=Bacillus rossius redtenbacheri TaxID=93214 RepID=UPI002FDDE503
MVLVSEAPIVWKNLKGILCVYKPPGVKISFLRKTVITNLCNDLCELQCRPPGDHVFIEGDPLKALTVRKALSFADHVLVVGPRYQPEDLRCGWAMHLGRDTSGVCVLGLNEGLRLARRLHLSRPTRAYHVKGLLGQATDTYFVDGQVVEKATFHHVKKSVVDKILAAMQAAHQKQMFEQCGVDIQSQAAYDLAVQGPIRPGSGDLPVLYGIKCVHFSPPHFTLEIQCINEYEMYLKTLVHELGLQLRSAATCAAVQCIRYGHLTTQHALLRRHWRLQHVLANLRQCAEALGHGALARDSAALVAGVSSAQRAFK